MLDVPVESILNSDRLIFNVNVVHADGHVENGYAENIHHDKESMQQFLSMLQHQFEVNKQQNGMLVKAIEAFTKKL